MRLMLINVSVFCLIALTPSVHCISDDIVTGLIEEINSLKDRIIQNENSCSTKLVAMETQLQNMETKLELAEQTISAMMSTPGNMNSTHSLSRRQTSYQVAFTAYMSAHSRAGQKVLPFDSLLLNEGGAFSTATYRFTCPVYGTYMFQSSVMAAVDSMAQTEIVKNGAGLVTQYSAGSSGSHGFDQGFNSVITQCSKGDSVWVQTYLTYAGTVFSSKYTTFSGYLLW